MATVHHSNSVLRGSNFLVSQYLTSRCRLRCLERTLSTFSCFSWSMSHLLLQHCHLLSFACISPHPRLARGLFQGNNLDDCVMLLLFSLSCVCVREKGGGEYICISVSYFPTLQFSGVFWPMARLQFLFLKKKKKDAD